MIVLKNKETGDFIASLTEEQLKYLIDELEEEHSEDKDYWFNRTQVDVFKDKGADPSLIAILESALGDNDEVEVEWEKT